MKFEGIERSSLAEYIASRFLEMIREKKLLPGEKLPPERELAIMLEVSRPSLREALRALSIMKIIEIRQGDGAYISSLEPEDLLEHLDFVYTLNDASLLELFEAREILEVGIVALAVEKINDDQINELKECVEISKKNINNPDAFIAADVRLHEIICEAARNDLLSRMIISIGKLSRASRIRTTEIAGVPEQVVEDHKKIVSAIEARDPIAAQEAMFAHLKFVEESLRRTIQGNPTPK